MSPEELRPYIEFVGTEKILAHQANSRAAKPDPGDRPLRQLQTLRPLWPVRTRVSMRDHLSGIAPAVLESAAGFFAGAVRLLVLRKAHGRGRLKGALNETGLLLGLLADQHAGNNGLRLPFFGHECSTSAAPAIFALRYRCPLHTAICYRIGLARWRIETGDEIPTFDNGHSRSVRAITLDINHALEAAVRRDPANWFWVHNRWKPAKKKARGLSNHGGSSPKAEEARA